MGNSKLEIMYCEKNEKPEWLKKLEILYDDCNVHDLDYTIKEYKKQFNKNLLDNYLIKDIIGSGSIGQVYLIEDINSKKEMVMKGHTSECRRILIHLVLYIK